MYVGELDINVTDQILFSFFSGFYTSILSAKVIFDGLSKRPKGYGFVKFGNFSDFERSLKEMDGELLLKKRIKVNQAQTSTKKPQGMSNNINQHPFSYPTNYEATPAYGNNYYTPYTYNYGQNQETSFFSNLIKISNFDVTGNTNMNIIPPGQTNGNFNDAKNENQNLFKKLNPLSENETSINKDVYNNLLMKASADPYSTFTSYPPPLKKSCGLNQFLYYYNIISVQHSVDNNQKHYSEYSKYGYTDSDLDQYYQTSDNRK